MPEDIYTLRRRALRRIHPQPDWEDDDTWAARVGLYLSTEVPEIPDIPTTSQINAEASRRRTLILEAAAKEKESKRKEYFSNYRPASHQHTKSNQSIPSERQQSRRVQGPKPSLSSDPIGGAFDEDHERWQYNWFDINRLSKTKPK